MRRIAGVATTLALVLALSGCGSGLAELSSATQAAAPTQTYMEAGDPPVRLAVNDTGQG